MTDDLILTGPNKLFEDIKKIDEEGVEYWMARELMSLLGYSEWRNFEEVINRAAQACMNSGQNVDNHFVGVNKMVRVGSNAPRKVNDWKLDRYACYLIAQNGDSRKTEVASAQTYFAIQTRRQELFDQLAESEKRLYIRGEVSEQNKRLFSTAKKSGVSNFGLFNDAGYKGLYGKSLLEVEQEKGIKRGELLDRAGATELAANLFRITQTDEKLKKDNIQGEREASSAHNMIGGKVRQTIKDIGGVLPEELPAEKHIRELERELKQIGATEQKKIKGGDDNQSQSLDKLVIMIPRGTTVEALKKLNNLLRNNSGPTPVALELSQKDSVKTMNLPITVEVTGKLRMMINEILDLFQ